jgi:hypothetical protein
MNKRIFTIVTPKLFGNSREQQILALLLEGNYLEIAPDKISIWGSSDLSSIILGHETPIGVISPQRNDKILATFFKSLQQATYGGVVVVDFPYYQIMMAALIL